MKAPRLAVGLRTRLLHLSVAVIAALAAALGCLIDRETGATIRATAIALIDQAQPIVAAGSVELLARGDDAALEQLYQEVVATDPFELAACFNLDGSLRAVASRWLLTSEQQAALREYGAKNAIRSLQKMWRPRGLKFIQHPLLDAAHDFAARGTLLLATNPSAVEARIGALSRYLWAAALLGASVAALAVVLLARALTQPLLALVADVRRLEGGLPVERPATSRRDEIGGLARAFGQMAQTVQQCRLELKQRGERLAQAVAQRKQTLDRALRDLKELGRKKDAFLSSISHELRTPITVMQSSAEILAADGDPAAQREFLPAVREHALALDRLVDNLLCMLDLEQVDRRAMPQPSTLRVIVDAALAEVEPERARRNVTIARELDGDLAVRWDVALTVRLLRELVLNAVRFSPPGGTVWLSARTAGPRLHVAVEDEGPGIPAALCEEVFQRFHQIGDVLTEKPRGTGLGLPICRAIAVRHGGWVRAEPAAEAGAAEPGADRGVRTGGCFFLELPIDAFTDVSAAEALPHELVTGR